MTGQDVNSKIDKMTKDVNAEIERIQKEKLFTMPCNPQPPFGQPNVFDAVKDSGKRQEFTTGSVRDTQDGKGRFDLISPIALERLARHYENGSRKYSERNWELGQPLSRYLDSALRHINAHLRGDREEDNLAAAAWNVFGFIHTEDQIRKGLLPQSLDNMPKSYNKVDSCEKP